MSGRPGAAAWCSLNCFRKVVSEAAVCKDKSRVRKLKALSVVGPRRVELAQTLTMATSAQTDQSIFWQDGLHTTSAFSAYYKIVSDTANFFAAINSQHYPCNQKKMPLRLPSILGIFLRSLRYLLATRSAR